MTNTLLDIAVSNPDLDGDNNGDFDILVTALGLFPDLVTAAGDPNASLTVFGPTDQAFLNFANGLNPSVGTDESAAVAAILAASSALSPVDDPTAFLGTVLTYHIAGQALTGTQVVNSAAITTLSGDPIRPDGLTLRDNDPDATDPNVTNPTGSENGIAADNGILHVLDNVLQPFDIIVSPGGALNSGRGQDAVLGTAGADVINLGRGDDIGVGFGGADIIRGGLGSDTIKGGNNNDSLFGGNDGDLLEGEAGFDLLAGGLGSDTLNGGEGNDELFGHRGADVLSGNAGDDSLFGGRGDDTLEGGQGDDFLSGFRSGDDFIFNPFRANEGRDVIRDFNPSNDKLVLDLRDGDLDLLAAIAAEGEEGLQFTDLLTFDSDANADGVQALVSLGAAADGDLLITHPTGLIKLNGISADVDPGALLPAIEFLLPEDMAMV